MAFPHFSLVHSPHPRPLLITSSAGGGVTALVPDGLGARPLPLEDVLPRPLPRPLAAVLPRATAPVAGSDAYFLADVGVGAVVALVLTIREREWRWSDTNSYRLDTNWTQVVARKKE